MSQRSDVLVIGAGVIGCACAYYLSRSGVSVTVLDKGAVGHGSSYGNAGWIVPSHGMPLPTPGALRQSLRWLLDRDSPLYIQPRLSWDLASWLLRFLSFSTQRHLRYAAPVLVEMANRSLDLFQDFVSEHGAEPIHFRQRGLVYVAKTRKGLDHALEEMKLAGDLGVPCREVSADEVLSMQPALKTPLVGGAYYEKEAQAEPLKLVETLARVAEQQGARVLPRTEVFSINTGGGKIRSLRTTRGDFEAEHYVLAAGSWTPLLGRRLGLSIPIQAGKGYSLVIPSISPEPTMPMNFVERRVGLTPRNGTMRLAGTMELAGLNESITERRVDTIIRGAREFVDLPDPLNVIETWRGLRPCTPDGIAMIGRPQGWSNLILAAGHAMLGLTMSMATGELVTDLCQGSTTKLHHKPYDPSRF
jgi:D-amino-acid dehydrogenase